MVVSRSFTNFLRSSLNSIIPVGSSPLTGSSNIKNSGSPNNATPSASRCFIPNEKFATLFLPAFDKPINSKVLAMQLLFGIPLCILCTSKFCEAVISLYSAGISIVHPIFDRSYCRLSLCPNRIISPSLLKLRPVNNLISVVFPAPFSPTSPYISPFGIVKFTFFKA